MKSVVVFGGYGVFGAHVCRALAARGLQVVVAGRDPGKAGALAAELGPAHRGIACDVTDERQCRAALEGHAVAACAAGPFSRVGPTLLGACLDAGCHYTDIADDRAHAARVRAMSAAFADSGLTAAWGCSSLPGISGALGLLAIEGVEERPRAARITLFIGNDNPKGEAAIRSAQEVLGKSIAAPQGALVGFRDREVVPLPAPFGARAVYNFESPEYDLFPELLGVREVRVKVGFELRAANLGFALLARLSIGPSERLGSALVRLGNAARLGGCSGGVVMTELFWDDGRVRRMALGSDRDGQRMAALPCALAASALCAGEHPRGARTAYELLGARGLVDAVRAEGFALTEASSPGPS